MGSRRDWNIEEQQEHQLHFCLALPLLNSLRCFSAALMHFVPSLPSWSQVTAVNRMQTSTPFGDSDLDTVNTRLEDLSLLIFQTHLEGHLSIRGRSFITSMYFGCENKMASKLQSVCSFATSNTVFNRENERQTSATAGQKLLFFND